jgi:RNA polymerase sigma-70 factor (ECF subfamily)
VKATEDRLRSFMIQGLNGDAVAHSQLLNERARLLRTFLARRFSGDPMNAEDLVQETLVAVHRRRESYDPAKPFTAWAFAMVRYKLIDELRRHSARVNLPLDDIDDLLPEDDDKAATASLDVARLLQDLSEQQKTAIRQVKIEGCLSRKPPSDLASRPRMSKSASIAASRS